MVRARRLASPLGVLADAGADRHGGRTRRRAGAEVRRADQRRSLVGERDPRVRPDVVFGNEAEHAELPVPSESRVVKRGSRGATIDGDDYPPVPGDVVDTTGAGDALAAGYLVGGPKLAMETAAR